MMRPLCLLLLGQMLCTLLAACNSVAEPHIVYDPAQLRFSGERALALETEFVSRFPHRHSGAPNNRLAVAWLHDRLARLGWTCRLDEWEIVNYSRPVPLRNVICELPGASPQQILVVAHHDQSPDTIQGADNNGSGIAILLHLAEIFASAPRLPYTLVFVTSDAEEYGMIGTRRYMQTHPQVNQIIAGISLDNLGKIWSNGLIMDPRGQFRGYGALWLQLTARAAARTAHDLWIPRLRSPLDQVLDQAVPVSFMDEGPLVAAGMPAFGFATTYTAGSGELVWQTFHSPDDTLLYQSADALHQAGRVTEALLRQLLAMEQFPQERGPYLYFDDRSQVLRGVPLTLLFLTFVGIFLVSGALLGGTPSAAKLRAWRRVLPHFLVLWLPLLAALILLYTFVAVGLMDKYHLYPATNKDEPLFEPRWPAVVLFLLGLVLFLILGRRLAARATQATALHAPEAIKSLALFIVGLAGVYILAINPFSLLFMVPLVFWLFINGRRKLGWVLDLVLFVLGGLIVYFLIYFFGFVILRNDFAILWYLMMMFSIGMIGWPTAAVIMAILAAGLSMIVPLPKQRVMKQNSLDAVE